MTYSVNDTSVHDGTPIECYEFVGSLKTWRLTSSPVPVTVAGEDYEPAYIVRTAVEVTSVIDSIQTMDFIIAHNHEIAVDYCSTRTPQSLSVKVYRVHEGDDWSTDYKIEYIGELSGSSIDGNLATLSTASKTQTRLSNNLSSVYSQRSCNHELFDDRCKLVRADWTSPAEVTKIQGRQITVDDQVASNGELVGGKMRNLRTGEEQYIVSNVDNVLRVGLEFFDILLGDDVELTLGCDHLRLGDCKTRFNNVVNYGGFDFIPSNNPLGKLNDEVQGSGE